MKKHGKPGDVAARVERIVGMMRRLEWDRGKSAVVLAEEWGLEVSTVENYSAEASRVIAREIEPEALKESVTIAMLELVKGGKPIERIKAADVAAKLVGVYAAQKFEISTERLQFEALPRAEQARRLRERAAECIAEAERLEADEVKGELPEKGMTQ